MNKEEFIGKLEMVYVGDRNAFNELVEDNQKLKNEIVYSKVEIDRLNNIMNQLEKYIKTEIPEEEFVNSEWYVNILDKLQELKEK